MPTWRHIEEFVHRYLDGLSDYKKGDLLSQGHVAKMTAHMKKMGWRVREEKRLFKDTLPDSHFLVQQLHTRHGHRFMRNVQRHPQIYSKLERISSAHGGRALVRDLLKLPDAAKYANPNRARGVPQMKDFLPKHGNSRQPQIRDYNKPTGKIYTEDQLLKRLKEMHQRDLAALAQIQTASAASAP
ncbi:MAG: hypothetical protein QGG36_32650 [Pirellulaceae bacterium]|jgi:hypothetical protein|nr:hypothetical protein [Pirellulaceae bacterium]